MVAGVLKYPPEESPGSTGQIAGESSGAGDREDSATEMKTADG